MTDKKALQIEERIQIEQAVQKELPELVDIAYAVDTHTYEMLYLNPAGKRLFGEFIPGQKCYTFLEGKAAPCAFCRTLKENELSGEREYYHEKSNKRLLLRNRLLQIGNRSVRLFVGFDITAWMIQQHMLTDKLNDSLASSRVVLECLRLIALCTSWDSFKDRYAQAVQRIGEYLGAGSAISIRFDKPQDTVFWEREKEVYIGGKTPLSQIPARWMALFSQRQCITVKNVETLPESEYQWLQAENIDSLCAAPLHINECISGYVAFFNVDGEKLSNAHRLLSTMRYFIEIIIDNIHSRAALYKMSYYDALTGAYNRNAYAKDIQACTADKPVSMIGIVSFDINGISDINQTKGHEQGDLLLRQTVGRINELFPEAKVYRTGGDEFIALAYGIAHHNFHERVMALNSRFLENGKHTISIGNAWEALCHDIEHLAQIAEERMYRNKRDYYRVKAVHRRYRRKTDDILGLSRPGVLEAEIAAGRFHYFLQPKVSLQQDTPLIGAEALVRYFSPTGEMIPPDQFIPTLEDSRRIAELDFYGFATVCKQIETWLKQGRQIAPISVNFSRYSLSSEDFFERMDVIWKQTGIDKKYLKLEITETVEEDDNVTFRRTVRKLREQGYSVSIDDFGVRYANLALFSSCSFDELKIDKALIDDIEQNPKAQAIVQSVAEICRKMDVRLIVEGVETPSQAKLLLSLGCRGAQGYLFSKPLPVSEFENKYLPLT